MCWLWLGAESTARSKAKFPEWGSVTRRRGPKAQGRPERSRQLAHGLLYPWGVSLSDLRQIFRELHQEIEAADDIRQELRDELAEAARGLEGAVAGPDTALDHLREELAKHVVELEASHPKLTATVDRVIRQISRMGI